MPIPVADSPKKTASKKKNKERCTRPSYFGLENVATCSSNLSISQPATGSAVTDSSSEFATSFPLLELVNLQVAA